jgi:hypothetical protein
VDVAAWVALAEDLAVRPYPAEDNPGWPGNSGPSHHLVSAAVSGQFWDDWDLREETWSLYEGWRESLTEALTARWGRPQRLLLHTDLRRSIEGQVLPPLLGTLAQFVVEVDAWVRGGRTVMVGVGQCDKEEPVQLVIAAGDLDLGDVPLGDRLREWSGWLGRLRAPVAPHLKPGPDPTAIRALLGKETPDSVVEWFAWCAGVAPVPGQVIGHCFVLPGYYPVELGQTLSLAEPYQDPGDPYLSGAFLPLLDSGGSDLYAAAWSAERPEPVVVSVMPEAGPAVLAYATIGDFVATIIGRFVTGEYYVDANGRLAG